MTRSKEGTGKTVTFEVSAWWEPEDKKIRLRCNKPKKFILTVGEDGSKKRGHPKLFRELAKILKDAGAPAPE